ncbi:MAG: IclR family transcriptional regulator [Burkholderiaceae bacterium]|nr:MAG: IclR family transcriptional regulator [Burkholderiaceae bacterium]TAM11472.1 MAG: IclR family transcriptional regulator [Pusillimonas sp.]
MATADKSDNVRAVGRALEILLAFDPQNAELSAGELLKRVDLSRPTLYRLLYTLQEHGFVDSIGDPQRFRLGPSVAKLAHVWTSSLDLAMMAQPVLRRIWEQTGETVAMFVPQGHLRLCIAELPSPQPLSFKRGVGYTELITRGASGRAILAYMDSIPQEAANEALQSGLDPMALEAKLAETRKYGYASSHNELISGATAIAVPFFDRTGAVAGSIGVFGPEVRLGRRTLKHLVQLLAGESTKLSALLGYTEASHAAS